MEVWKKHPTYCKHECSTSGLVRRVKCLGRDGRRLQELLVKPTLSKGSWCVKLYGYSKLHVHSVGKLVLETFIGPCPVGMVCCHGKEGRNVHCLGNLSWGTQRKNLGVDRVRDGTMLSGEKHPRAVLTKDQVDQIRLALLTGETQRSIGKRFGVKQPTISDIHTGKKWKEN